MPSETHARFCVDEYSPRSGGMFVAHGFNRGANSSVDSHRSAVACGPRYLNQTGNKGPMLQHVAITSWHPHATALRWNHSLSQ